MEHERRQCERRLQGRKRRPRDLAQILGGVAVLIGVYFAWRNLTATTKNLELANKNFELATKDLELTKEGQVTDRFAKAIELLGAADENGEPKLELRLGGI
jgi:HAMP domain-containing protein